MRTKCLICNAILLLTVVAGFGQDTSKLPAGKFSKGNADTLNSIVDPGAAGKTNRNANTPHTVVSPNQGRMTPNTTSGTLNSSVNPNTQLVIPIHKSKRKINANATHDSGAIAPKQ